jgi:hypothetical protein
VHHVCVKKVLISVLLLSSLAAPAAATTGRGLYGVVMRGPTKPVCSSEEPCSEPAVHTRLRFMRGATLVSSVVTDSRGRYRLRLPRGVYTVRVAGAPQSGLGARIDPARVSVRAAWRRQNFDIDTGIR